MTDPWAAFVALVAAVVVLDELNRPSPELFVLMLAAMALAFKTYAALSAPLGRRTAP